MTIALVSSPAWASAIGYRLCQPLQRIAMGGLNPAGLSLGSLVRQSTMGAFLPIISLSLFTLGLHRAWDTGASQTTREVLVARLLASAIGVFVLTTGPVGILPGAASLALWFPRLHSRSRHVGAVGASERSSLQTLGDKP